MLGRKSASWLYPKPTEDLGRDRNARTVQFACFLLAFAVGAVAVLNIISREPGNETPVLVFAVASLVSAAVMNRKGRWVWAARTAFLAVLLTAILLVLEAHDGFRSHAMLIFPGLLLVSVMLLDRASYVTTAGIVLVAVAALGIAEKRGLTRAIPGLRTRTSYDSIFFVDLNLMVFASIGSRIARDNQRNALDLRASINGLSNANLELTERAAALRESEQQLVSIYNTVQDVIFYLAVEPEGRFRFVSVNAAFLSVTGLSPEKVVGKTVNEVIPEPSLAIVLEKYRQAIEENTTVLWEETSDYPTGPLTGEVSVAPVLDNQGTCTHLVGAVHDITERKRAEAALSESEARLKNAERLAHLGHWQWHLKSNRLIWSDECYRIFGQQPNYKPSLEDLLQTLIPEDRERVGRETGHRLAEKKGGAIEFHIVRPDRERRTVRSVSEMLLDEEGQPASFFGACQDITEERRAQEESVARQKLESVGTLASGIAHDFNNLLGGVLAQAELAVGELAAGSNPEAELKAIVDMALRGSEIVRELMIYAGKETAVVGPIDVSQIVKEMLELLKVSVSKHAVLEVDLDKGVTVARGHAAQIRQVVMNLVTNASDAIGDRDGLIRVRTRLVTINQDSGPISKRVADGNYVQLEVSDTGRGMSLETQAKMFDPFFTTKPAGHGLGLSIMQGLVRGLGGSIHLTSELGKGTTFQILLPAAEHATGSARDALSGIAESAYQYLNATVLVVEDEQMLREAVAKMLRKSGCKVLEAADGSTAIDLLRANKGTIDAILLDMTIPGASPPEIVFEAAQDRPAIRVLLTSAYSQEMIASSISAPQICGFIRKPFQLAELVQTLRRVVPIEWKN